MSSGDDSDDEREHGPALRALPARPPKHKRRPWGDRYARGREPSHLEKLVTSVLKANHVHVDIRRERLFAEWSAFVGDKIGARTKPREISGAWLVVEVSSSSWLHELRMMRPKLVADLIGRLGPPRIFDDLRLVLAGERRPRDTIRPSKPAPRPTAATPVRPASGAMALRILKETETVEDDDLRALIAKIRLANDR